MTAREYHPPFINKPESLVDILTRRATEQTHRIAYRFLPDGEREETILSYGELDRSACKIATHLQASIKKGDRALLLYPPGLEFIKAYFGCLYAGVIAVPVYPPHPARLERTLPMIQSIVADASPTAALMTTSLYDAIRSSSMALSNFSDLKWIVTDAKTELHQAGERKPSSVLSEDIAFLQYTSGSTGNPKGVMITHANLLHNLGYIKKNFGLSAESHAVFWLPPYHDMGLIGGILQSLYSGYPLTLLPHLAFLQRPLRWLQAISDFKADTSGGPNFAYDLCVKKIKAEQIESLDLSGWKVAFNGAEQVHHETLERFTRHFEPCGFSRKAFRPCYGMAEATLMITGGPHHHLPEYKTLKRTELSQNRIAAATSPADAIQTLVGCGQYDSDQKIIVVDPETLLPCPSYIVGEVWVSGKSVALGYWNKTSETDLIFKAKLTDSQVGSFLRTGDLGFISENELYITGRLKDLIISSGCNYYPSDIEKTVENAFATKGTVRCAAFSINQTEEESLVILVEIDRQFIDNTEELKAMIRQAVSVYHELRVADIAFVVAGGIPKTSSGKIKRYVCKDRYLEGKYKDI